MRETINKADDAPSFDTTFNEAHPPLMQDEDHLPPKQSDSERIGKPFIIRQADFDRVFDPNYAWQKMSDLSPEEWRKKRETRARKSEEVDCYVVKRERFWQQVDRQYYADDETVRVQYTVGTTLRHEETRRETFTQRIGIGLDLSIPGDLLSAAAPEAGAIFVAAPENAAENSVAEESSVGNFADLNFTWEMAHELEFTTIDEKTYSTEIQIEKTVQRRGGYYYIAWQIAEKLSIYRLPKHKQHQGLEKGAEFMKEMVALTKTTYLDRFKTSRADDNDLDDGGLTDLDV